MRVLFLGDIVGRPGRSAVRELLPELSREYLPDVILGNIENAAGGVGVKPEQVRELGAQGICLFTSGNHIFARQEIIPYLSKDESIVIRPINFSEGSPGRGFHVLTLPDGRKLGVINAIGRVMMDSSYQCPFLAVNSLLENELKDVRCRFVDFHAEATSEKVAFAHYLDAKIAAVVGTHTHVQTADERILKGGTATISDVGMCGAYDSVIGFAIKPVVQRFLSGKGNLSVAKGAFQVNAVFIEIDDESGKALVIERIQRIRH